MGRYIFATIFTIAIYAVILLVAILITKYLIRYGIDYFSRKKEYYDRQLDIDSIQQDLFRDHE